MPPGSSMCAHSSTRPPPRSAGARAPPTTSKPESREPSAEELSPELDRLRVDLLERMYSRDDVKQFSFPWTLESAFPVPKIAERFREFAPAYKSSAQTTGRTPSRDSKHGSVLSRPSLTSSVSVTTKRRHEDCDKLAGQVSPQEAPGTAESHGSLTTAPAGTYSKPRCDTASRPQRAFLPSRPEGEDGVPEREQTRFRDRCERILPVDRAAEAPGRGAVGLREAA